MAPKHLLIRAYEEDKTCCGNVEIIEEVKWLK
jgi:hypothetical protein